MSEVTEERRLTTILAADVVGYSRLMAGDEAGTLAQIKTHRKELIEPKANEYRGRVVKLMGDGTLMEFNSVVDAVHFAVDVQHAMALRNAGVPEDRRVSYRIGINIGDVIIESDDLYGDGVNVAARLEGLAEPGGICISRPVYTQVEGKVDLSFEDLGEQEFKNIPKPVRVFRILLDEADTGRMPVSAPHKPSLRWRAVVGGLALVAIVAGVLVWQWPREVGDEPAPPESAALTVQDKPSIAVLPFDNLSKDSSQDYLSDGMTNDIITDLSRFSGLFVIASNSTFRYKDKPVKVQEVARDLGVKYVLEGSLLWGGDRVRINAQLIDAQSGHHLWADRYHKAAEQFFAIQDEIITEIVANLALRVSDTERERAFRKGTENLTAYDYYLRAHAKFVLGSKEGYIAAIQLLEKAIEIDPDYARAMGLLAQVHLFHGSFGWAESKDVSHRLARDLALKAFELAPDDYQSHAVLSYIYLHNRQFEKATTAVERAMELNPNDPGVITDAAQLLIYLGRPLEAASQIEYAMRLSPYHPQWYFGMLGWALYDAGKYEEALRAMKKLDKPRTWVHRQMAMTYVRLGQIDKAKEQIKIMLKAEPDFRISKTYAWPYKDPSVLERYKTDLRAAGAPE